MAESDDKSKPNGGERVFVPQKLPVVPQVTPAQPQEQTGPTPAPPPPPPKDKYASDSLFGLFGDLSG